MDSWLDWDLFPETENRLKVILLNRLPEIHSLNHTAWLDILSRCSSGISQGSFELQDVNVEGFKESEIVDMIKKSLEEGTELAENKLTGIPYNSLNRVLNILKDRINEVELSVFCEWILSWGNNVLVEDSLRLVVLPKLKEIVEINACVTFVVKKLLNEKPDAVVHQLFTPLLTDETVENFDFEFFNEVLPVLNSNHKEALAMSVISKEPFRESDWMLLQSLLGNLSNGMLSNICNFLNKSGQYFTRSQIYGKFLVSFCKSVSSISDKKVLLEIVNQHQTLFKKQALKVLEVAEKNIK